MTNKTIEYGFQLSSTHMTNGPNTTPLIRPRVLWLSSPHFESTQTYAGLGMRRNSHPPFTSLADVRNRRLLSVPAADCRLSTLFYLLSRWRFFSLCIFVSLLVPVLELGSVYFLVGTSFPAYFPFEKKKSPSICQRQDGKTKDRRVPSICRFFFLFPWKTHPMEKMRRQLSVRKKKAELEWHPVMDMSRKRRSLPPITLFSAKRVVIKRETAVSKSKGPHSALFTWSSNIALGDRGDGVSFRYSC